MIVETVIALLLLVLGALWIHPKMRKVFRTIEMLDKIGGPKSHPIFGNTWDVVVAPEKLINVVCNFCPPTRSVSRVWLTKLKPYLLLHRASAVETVLSSNKVLTKSEDYDFLLPWLGRGLLIATGSKWFARRKMLTPAFHFQILEDFLDVFNEKTSILVDIFDKQATGEPVDIFNTVTLCTLDVILETAMGIDMNVQRNSDTEYVKAVQTLSGLVQERQKKPWLRPDFLYRLLGPGKIHDECVRILHKQSLSTIRERRQLLAQKHEENINNKEKKEDIVGKKKRLPFLDLLLRYSEEGGSLTDEEIREEVDTFMFEGHDTTATGINMTLYLLGRYPEIQDRVHAELDSVFGEDYTGPVTTEHIKELRFLEYCIKEALRLYPSVPIFGRVAEEDLVIDGHEIPAGTQLLIFTYQLHRDPEQFPQPEKFIPERFEPAQVSTRHPYSYIPFSSGPRNCIGQKFALMEEKVVLSSLLRKFKFESVHTHDELEVMGEIILRPKQGIYVKITKRNG